jgi:hypothetical protein
MVGNAGVYDRNLASLLPRQPQKVRPKFCLNQNQQLRAKYEQPGANREREIQRKVENILATKTVPGQSLAGRGGGRDQQPMAWKTGS